MANGQMPGLAGLAQGLRLAGGILSPSAREANLEEDKLQAQQAQQMKLAQIQQTVKGIEMGAIEPEAGRAVLKQLGFEAPVGLSAEGQARMEAVKQKRAVADAMAKLSPDATPEQRMAAIFPHLPPEQQVRLHEINTVKVTNLEQQLERIRNDARFRGLEHQRKVDDDAEDARLKAVELRIKQQIADLKGLQAPTERVNPTKVLDPNDPTRTREIVIDAYTGRKIGDAAPSAAAGGKMPAEIQRMTIALDSLTEGLKEYERIIEEEFNPRNPMDQADPIKRAKIEGLIANLRLQQKEADALGALTGPDVGILNQILRNPATLGGAYYGKGGLKAQIKEAQESVGRRNRAIAAQYPNSPRNPPPATPPPDAPPTATRQPVNVTGANETTQITRGGVAVPVGGRPAAPPASTGNLAEDARAAIQAGADPAAVRREYKKLTGQDL